MSASRQDPEDAPRATEGARDDAGSRCLRLLLVEDSPDDAELLVRELRRAGYVVTYERVDTGEAMAAALERATWDVVVSDYSMPRFDGLSALRLARERQPDTPFLIVSGTMGEETAVQAIQSGAADFFVKARLNRLGPAIERARREAVQREHQRKVEAQLLVADRMAAVGTLAAGVAHEINNPLAAILLTLELSIRELRKVCDPEELPALRERLEKRLLEASSAAMTVRQIVRDLKIFSRGEDERTGPVDVRKVMESTLRMAWNEVRHRARLVKAYGDVPPAKATEARLGQVFLNVVVNAAQAIPVGDSERHEIRVTTRSEGDTIVVSVRDTGSGVPPEILPRLFSPFATSKPVGEGTGLGLFLCRRIIESFGGKITVDSEVGQGTEVRIVLPKAPAEATAAVVAPKEVATASRRGRVLVVDDDAMVAGGIEVSLSPEHDVTLASGGRDALRRIAAGARFDVILCDLMMPDLTGMGFHDSLLRLAPDQARATIFMTGGAFTAEARAFLDEVENSCLEKPFDIARLRSAVNQRVR